jgi:hypothetical protein
VAADHPTDQHTDTPRTAVVVDESVLLVIAAASWMRDPAQ